VIKHLYYDAVMNELRRLYVLVQQEHPKAICERERVKYRFILGTEEYEALMGLCDRPAKHNVKTIWGVPLIIDPTRSVIEIAFVDPIWSTAP
jgi:hypothetical protein